MSDRTSDLVYLLSDLSVVRFGSDDGAFTDAQSTDRVDEAIGKIRAIAAVRDLTIVESYYFGVALRHQANLVTDRDAKREIEVEAFSWFKNVFFDPDLPDAYPALRTRTLDELQRPEVADVLLGMLEEPHPPLEDPDFADQLASYLWSVGDGYWPSMFRYAITLERSGDPATCAGLLCDLIRRATNGYEPGDRPPSGPVIWAGQTLKVLAKQAKQNGAAALAAEYGAAAGELTIDGGWREAVTGPAVVALTESAVRTVTSAGSS